LTTENLNDVINQSELIISRSGYSTILDLASLGKKAFFIPTPGQTEQEYLAKKFQLKGVAPFCKQSEFRLQKLDELQNYSGFTRQESQINPDLFKTRWM